MDLRIKQLTVAFIQFNKNKVTLKCIDVKKWFNKRAEKRAIVQCFYSVYSPSLATQMLTSANSHQAYRLSLFVSTKYHDKISRLTFWEICPHLHRTALTKTAAIRKRNAIRQNENLSLGKHVTFKKNDIQKKRNNQ